MQNNIYEINTNKLLECIDNLEKRIEVVEEKQEDFHKNIKWFMSTLVESFSAVGNELNCLINKYYP